MRVLNLSGSDEIGRRFNGFDLHFPLASLGVESWLGCFWNHTSDASWVFNPFPGKLLRKTATAVKIAETMTGHQSRFQFWSSRLYEHPMFISADVVHLQIVHDYWLRLEAIQEISRRKPTLWTWHDLWPLTGHCISPVGCPRWAAGCGECPDLAAPLRVARDRTAAEHARKVAFLSSLDVDITVSTDWSVKHIRKHLGDTSIRLHVLPFGIDTEMFRPRRSASGRRDLGLSEETIVVMARSTLDPQKGFIPLVQALEELCADYDITLLTVHERDIAARYSTRLKVVEMGWVSDADQLVRLFSASDIFAMPSTGESFGMMALEAMACGVPVLHLADTATAEVVACSTLAVPPTNPQESLRRVLSEALDRPERLAHLGATARKRAVETYGQDQYLRSLVSLYRRVANRREQGTPP